MATWAEFAAAAPETAERGAARLAIGFAYIATVSGDGSPRVHPMTPLIAGGRLFVFVAVHTVKYRNLLRDRALRASRRPRRERRGVPRYRPRFRRG